MFPKPKDAKRTRHDVVDGVQYIVDKTTRLVREVCITKAARERRRREVFEASREENGVARCADCRARITFEFFHWHHKRLRGMGAGFRNDALDNALALCSCCHDKRHNHI